MSLPSLDVDVLVVGGGAAGLTAASPPCAEREKRRGRVLGHAGNGPVHR